MAELQEVLRHRMRTGTDRPSKDFSISKMAKLMIRLAKKLPIRLIETTLKGLKR